VSVKAAIAIATEKLGELRGVSIARASPLPNALLARAGT
jgi:hypothetical protein